MDILEQLKSYIKSDSYTNVDKVLNFISLNKNPFSRDNISGHITGSAWILNRDLSLVLLTHHRKLKKWIQTGGHCEGEKDPFLTALREGEEETGLKLTPIKRGIFHLDIHNIPHYKGVPAHKHYDFTYIFSADSNINYSVSDESLDLKWFNLDRVNSISNESNIIQLQHKSFKLIKEIKKSVINC